jgi:hypothetical protein
VRRRWFPVPRPGGFVRGSIGGVVAHYAAIAKRTVLDTWAFAHGQGLIVGAVVAVLSIVAESVGERHVHLVHLVVAVLAAVGAVLLVALAVNAVLAPVRIERERSASHAAALAELGRDHDALVAGLEGQHEQKVAELEHELATAQRTVNELRAAEPIGPSRFPRTLLERAIAQQIAAGETIERERPVRGDGGYFDAVVKWAGDTSNALREANAGDLVVEFEKDGIPAPATVEKIDDYMAAQIRHLSGALAQLRSDESPATSKLPSDPVKVLRAERQAADGVRDWMAHRDDPDGKLSLDEDRVFVWAQRVYRVLRLSFEEHADTFMGTSLAELSPRYFAVAYSEQLHKVGRRRYLHDRIALLDGILRESRRS